MNAFLRTFIFGMAMLGMFLVGGLLALLYMLKSDDSWREAARNALLSDFERRVLSDQHARRHEPPRVRPPASTDMERLIAEISDQMGRSQVAKLVEELEAKQAANEDLRAHLQQRESEIRMASGDLQRVRRDIQQMERRLEEQRREMREEHERFARAQVEAQQAIRALNEHERERYRDLAQVYEAMRNDAWLQLRQMDADEIARILTFMQERRAANILGIAARDVDFPGKSLEIHRALLRLDPDGDTQDQIQRLALLYTFMSADNVLTNLANSSSDEVAQILLAMQDRPRLVAEILQQMERRDDPRLLDVQRMMRRAENGRGGR